MASQRQTQQLKLLQKLSPQQIQLMKLLQIPSVDLEERIKQEIEENPALEGEGLLGDAQEDENRDADGFEDNSFDDDEKPLDDNDEDRFDPYDYNEFLGDDDDVSSYKYRTNNTSPDDEHYEAPIVNEQSFQEHLTQQLGFRKLTEKKYNIGVCIIGNIDDRGYLSSTVQGIVDILAFSMGIMATEEEVDEVLRVVQDFDPPGVAARDLRECLIIQLDRLQQDEPEKDFTNARTIISDYYDEFIKKHYDKIAKSMGLDDVGLKDALDAILKLDPSPGNSFGDSIKSNHILPDFFVYSVNGKLELTLSDRNYPELRVSPYYSEMLKSLSKKNDNRSNREAINFVKQKIDSAVWFIDAIRQRQNTLRNTMEAIMNYQKEFFMTGDETTLRPMILKDISDIVGLDISTVSRVANSKYVQTDFGTFLLKTFFNEGMVNDEGEEVSTREIKKIMSDCIEAENKQKPLTDDALSAMLKEKGYPIARRTIQKYREQLGIPVARLRKRI